jgi:iron(III) transport system substrate-binding protein
MSNPPRSRPARTALRIAVPFAVVAVVLVLHAAFWRNGPEPLVVYCSHDQVYAQSILDGFTRQTGIPLAVKYDTEATKSLGLVELLLSERGALRCDVFWNNEALGTMDLAAKGVLEPYEGPGYGRIPAEFKDPDGLWAGFGARLRVCIVNTDRMQATPAAVEQALSGDLSRMAVARPIFGTTLTHYSVLWHLWGGERLRAWNADLRRRGVQVVTGNAQVKNLVADGVCNLGWTDSDDYFGALDAGKPVAAVPVRVDGGRTICIPNTVAVIKGARHPEEARRLADYLLSAGVEAALASSDARQVPLGPVDEAALPAQVRELAAWARDGIRLSDLGPARDACLAWLKGEYAQ